MKRFQQKKAPFYHKNFIISILLFLLILSILLFHLQSLTQVTDQAELQTLTLAIQRNVTLCYTLEGSYPESLDYLKTHYGLRYDEKKYFVGYEVFGENVIPDITIVKRNGGSL